MVSIQVAWWEQQKGPSLWERRRNKPDHRKTLKMLGEDPGLGGGCCELGLTERPLPSALRTVLVPAGFAASPPAGAPGPNALCTAALEQAPSWNSFTTQDFLSFSTCPLPPSDCILLPFVPPSASSHNSHELRTPFWTPLQSEGTF